MFVRSLVIALGSILMARMPTCAAAAQGRVLYVDSAAGSDANRGDSPTAAWASLDRASTAPLQPGDTVRFKRGGVWRGTLIPHSGSPGVPITYTAYGEGPKPLLLGSVARDDPSDWERTGDSVWATLAPTWQARQVVADLRQSEWNYHREQGAKISTRVTESATGRTHVVECQQSGSRSNHLQAWGPELDWEKAAEARYLQLRLRARCTKPFAIGSVRVMRGDKPWITYASAGRVQPEVGADWRDYEVPLQVFTKGESPRLHLDLGGALPAWSSATAISATLAAAISSPGKTAEPSASATPSSSGAPPAITSWRAAASGKSTTRR